MESRRCRPTSGRGGTNEGFAEARVWFDLAAESSFGGEQARAVLGRILLGQTFWRLEAMGAERLARLRRNFEAPLASKYVSPASGRMTSRRI